MVDRCPERVRPFAVGDRVLLPARPVALFMFLDPHLYVPASGVLEAEDWTDSGQHAWWVRLDRRVYRQHQMRASDSELFLLPYGPEVDIDDRRLTLEAGERAATVTHWGAEIVLLVRRTRVWHAFFRRGWLIEHENESGWVRPRRERIIERAVFPLEP